MAVMVSNRYMYVQFIDDQDAVTLASASTLGMDDAKCNVQGARRFGALAAQSALEKGIKFVVVDRGGFKFHGRVRAIVEAAVETGLTIRVHPAEDEDEQSSDAAEGKEAK